jgi:hypothetical protein
MPKDSAEFIAYFESVENLFELYGVPKDIQSKLLIAKLSGKPKSLISKLSVTQLNDYKIVKDCILKEFQITPRELRARFVQAKKREDESYAIFRGRLELSLLHYLKSRNAHTEVAKLIDLIVADKLKDTLSPATLHYVLGLEGAKIFAFNDVFENADIYSSNYTEQGNYKGNNLLNVPLLDDKAYQHKPFPYVERQFDAKRNGNGNDSVSFVKNPIAPTSASNDTRVAWHNKQSAATTNTQGKVFTNTNAKLNTCYGCHAYGHKVANCPLKKSKPNAAVNSCVTDQLFSQLSLSRNAIRALYITL